MRGKEGVNGMAWEVGYFFPEKTMGSADPQCFLWTKLVCLEREGE